MKTFKGFLAEGKLSQNTVNRYANELIKYANFSLGWLPKDKTLSREEAEIYLTRKLLRNAMNVSVVYREDAVRAAVEMILVDYKK